jgi:hypothetical protein
MNTESAESKTPVQRFVMRAELPALCGQQFEEWISQSPYERSVERYPDDPEHYAWPGCYRDLNVQLAWDAWAEGWDMAHQQTGENK